MATICTFIFLVSLCFAGTLALNLKKIGEKFYYIDDSSVNWHNAMLKCRKMGLFLATLNNEKEQHKLSTFLNRTRPPYSIYWLGGTDLHAENQWVWSSSGEPINYTAWSPGEPNNFNDSEHCLVMVTNTLDNWEDIPCHRPDPGYICELNTGTWRKLHVQLTTTFENYQYYIYKDNLFVTWFEANDLCDSFGMELAELDSEEQVNFLKKYFPTLPTTPDKNFWLGARKFSGNEWTWEKSNRTVSVPKKQTLSSIMATQCLEIRLSGDYFGTRCNYKQRFICQLKVPTPADNCVTFNNDTSNSEAQKPQFIFFPNEGLIFLILLLTCILAIICTIILFSIKYQRLQDRFLTIRSSYFDMTKGENYFDQEEKPENPTGADM